MIRPRSHTAVFFSVILLALVAKLFALDVMRVSGPSMQPTLPPGTFVLENKLAWGVPIPLTNRYLVRWGEPRAGDVIIYPILGRYVIKRCVAGPGERLAFSTEGGYSVRIGDITVPLNADQWEKLAGSCRIPDGMIFALGDNMNESRDSRDYGFVSIDSVRGKVLWN